MRDGSGPRACLLLDVGDLQVVLSDFAASAGGNEFWTPMPGEARGISRKVYRASSRPSWWSRSDLLWSLRRC